MNKRVFLISVSLIIFFLGMCVVFVYNKKIGKHSANTVYELVIGQKNDQNYFKNGIIPKMKWYKKKLVSSTIQSTFDNYCIKQRSPINKVILERKTNFLVLKNISPKNNRVHDEIHWSQTIQSQKTFPVKTTKD